MAISFLKLIDRFSIEEISIEPEGIYKLRDIEPSKRIAFHSFSVRQTGQRATMSTVFLSVPDFYTMTLGVGKGFQFETLIEIYFNDSDESIFNLNFLNNMIKSLLDEKYEPKKNYSIVTLKHRTYDEALLFHNAALDKLLSMSNESISETLRTLSDKTDCLDSYYRDILLNMNSDFIGQLFPTRYFDHIRLLD